MPARGDTGSIQWKLRNATPGRLLCDTFLSAQDLIKETNYDLGYLVKNRLKKQRFEVTNEELETCYKRSDSLIQVITKNEEDCGFCKDIMEIL